MRTPPVLAALLLVVGTAAPAGAQSPVELLTEARRLYDSVDWEGAAAALDRAVSLLEPRAQLERGVVRDQLVNAYELRARVRYNLKDEQRAAGDLQGILRYTPGYRIPADVSPKLVVLFDQVRKTSVADLLLAVTPANADVDIDGQPVTDRSGSIALAAGNHTIAARRAGYKAFTEDFTLEPGSVKELGLTLERSSATISIITSPVGVDVVVDGASRGITQSGPTTPEVQKLAQQLKVEPLSISAPLELTDLAKGGHTLDFKLVCYVPESRTIQIDRLEDVPFAPVTLKPAVATLRLDTTAPGATAFVDDVRKGLAPMTLGDVCEGPRTIEMRSPYGRLVRRVTLRAGEQQTISGNLKPAFALLSVYGVPEGLRGGGDLRVAVENRLTDSRSVTIFAPPLDRAAATMVGQRLEVGWLAMNRAREPISAVAKNIVPEGRRELSEQLSRSLDTQGVAEVTVVDGREPNDVLVSLLAVGSTKPDVLQFKLNDPETVRRVLAELDVDVLLHRPSLGVLAVDVEGVPGPVVVAVDPSGPGGAAGIQPGEAIAGAGGRVTPNAVSLAAALQSLEEQGKDAQVSLDVRDRSGTVRKVDAKLVRVGRALSQSDQTLLFNPILVRLRNQLVGAAGTPEEPFIRLNIGIALMSLGNWQEARSELERVQLPDGTGVAKGTVHYLLGVCYEALAQFGEAEKAWNAAKATESGLTEDGPPVKALAEARLARLAGTRRSGQ